MGRVHLVLCLGALTGPGEFCQILEGGSPKPIIGQTIHEKSGDSGDNISVNFLDVIGFSAKFRDFIRIFGSVLLKAVGTPPPPPLQNLTKLPEARKDPQT